MADNFYNQVGEEVRECLWDIQDILDGRSNDLTEDNGVCMESLYNVCKKFINEYEKYKSKKMGVIEK